MIKVIEGKVCEVCKKNDAVVVCSGCGKALCKECRTFDVWCYGCGHGDTMVFCKECNKDPDVNIWKGRE